MKCLGVLIVCFAALVAATANSATQQLKYDPNGNLLSGEGLFYEHNDANKLVRVRRGASDGEVIAEYWYDYQGQRVKKIEHGVTTYYIGKHYEERRGPTLNERANFYFAGGQRVARKVTTGNKPAERVFYLGNHLGSADVVVDSSGSTVDEMKYFPFGAVRNTGSERYGYTGKERDESTGLNYYEARYYNSGLRHFSQADIVTPNVYKPQSLNRYSYVENGPLKYVDVSGNSPTNINSIYAELGLQLFEDSFPNVDYSGNMQDILFSASIEFSKSMTKVPDMKIVSVSGYLRSNGTWVEPYYRRVPNAVKSGAGSISHFVGPLVQSVSDSFRDDLSGGQKLGRTSISIIPYLDTAGSVIMGGMKLAHNSKIVRQATGLEKEQVPTWDSAKSTYFSNENPIVDKSADMFRSIFGDEWLLRQDWLDAF